MSSASTINLPYNNIIVLEIVAPVIVSNTAFNYNIINNREIPSGKYLASVYFEITEEGNDTELGTITTSFAPNPSILYSVPWTSNYLGSNSFIEMQGINFETQNMQIIEITDTTLIDLTSNILFQNTAPTSTGYIILQAL
jgi:hypothetical protein